MQRMTDGRSDWLGFNKIGRKYSITRWIAVDIDSTHLLSTGVVVGQHNS